jgi:hypothetical protein
LCFDGGINLFFHVFVPGGLAKFTESNPLCVLVGVHRGNTLIAKNARARQDVSKKFIHIRFLTEVLENLPDVERILGATWFIGSLCSGNNHRSQLTPSPLAMQILRKTVQFLCLLFLLPLQHDAEMKKRARFNPMRHLMMQTLWETAVDFHFSGV